MSSQNPENEQVERISAEEFRANVRELIDLCIQSGVDPDDVEGILDELEQGVQYFYEDAHRYTSRQSVEDMADQLEQDGQ